MTSLQTRNRKLSSKSDNIQFWFQSPKSTWKNTAVRHWIYEGRNDSLLTAQSITESTRPIARGGGHLNVTWRGGAHFFENLHNLFKEKTCISMPCFRIFRLQNNRENNNKTIAYCSLTNNHNLFRTFWSIFIPCSGILAENWYVENGMFR